MPASPRTACCECRLGPPPLHLAGCSWNTATRRTAHHCEAEAAQQAAPLDVDLVARAFPKMMQCMGWFLDTGEGTSWETVAQAFAAEYARLAPAQARPADAALREALYRLHRFTNAAIASDTKSKDRLSFNDLRQAATALGETAPNEYGDERDPWPDETAAALAQQPTAAEEEG